MDYDKSKVIRLRQCRLSEFPFHRWENEIRVDMGDDVSIINTYDTTIIYQLEKTEIE